MQEFNDQTAPHQIPFEAYGMEMRICTNSPELLARIEPMMPPFWRRRPRADSQHLLGLLEEDNDLYSIYNNSICIHDSPGKELALLMMDAQIQGYVALEAPDYIFIHAGVVADGDRAIVMPGMSFAGKTTLVRALVDAGATYYSDEFAVLDANGRVLPYPKPLSIRNDPRPTIDYPVEELGGVAGVDPLPVKTVIVTRYRPGAAWEPREVTGGAAALLLLEHAVPAQTRPEQTLRHIKQVIARATVLEGERGDADELAQVLLETLRAAA
jgi:hypothetical protein